MLGLPLDFQKRVILKNVPTRLCRVAGAEKQHFEASVRGVRQRHVPKTGNIFSLQKSIRGWEVTPVRVSLMYFSSKCFRGNAIAVRCYSSTYCGRCRQVHEKTRDSGILVMTHMEDGKWVIVGIELHERSRHFIHFILGSYSNKYEAGEAFSNNEIFGCAFWSAGYANLERRYYGF